MLITLKVANLIEYKDTRLQRLQNEVIIMVSDFTKKAQKYIEELSDKESLLRTAQDEQRKVEDYVNEKI